MPSLTYSVVDVFTDTRYSGNQLAIVHLPPSTDLTSVEKQKIALEFGFAETVFLYEPAQHTDDLTVSITIHDTDVELPFAGHPTVGTSFYITSGLWGLPVPKSLTLSTKAGLVPVITGEGGTVGVRAPADFKIHEPLQLPYIREQQPAIEVSEFLTATVMPVSIVKGMTFLMVPLSSEDALRRMQPYVNPPTVPEGHLGEWDGFKGVYAYVQKGNSVRVRMFYSSGCEDAATGSAACAAAAYLAGGKDAVFDILQGVEMGRRSEIRVVVEFAADGGLKNVELHGMAVGVMKGQLET